MSENLQAWLKHLKLISSISNSKKRNAKLKTFADNPSFYEALSEIARNTINMNIPLKNNQKRKLRKHSKIIKELSQKRKRSKPIRKKLINQSGGFLPILIPTVISILGELIRNG